MDEWDREEAERKPMASGDAVTMAVKIQGLAQVCYMQRIADRMAEDEPPFETTAEMIEFNEAIGLLTGFFIAEDHVAMRALLMVMGIGHVGPEHYADRGAGDGSSIEALQMVIRQARREGRRCNPMIPLLLRKMGVPEEDIP